MMEQIELLCNLLFRSVMFVLFCFITWYVSWVSIYFYRQSLIPAFLSVISFGLMMLATIIVVLPFPEGVEYACKICIAALCIDSLLLATSIQLTDIMEYFVVG